MSQQYARKVNLGCGFDIREGYLNVDLNDFHKPDLVADVTNLDMLPGDYFEEILAYDILEHIERTRTIDVLIEWNRILKIDGLLSIQVPSLIDLVELLKQNQNNISKSMELVQACFGTQNYTGDFHYTSFTKQLITYQLSESGFELLTLKLRDGWLFELTAKKVKCVDIHSYKENKMDIYKDQVNQLYKSILGRDADNEGLHYYINELINGSATVEKISDQLKDSDEYKGK